MGDGQNMLNRPVTQEEIDEILRDRAHRLDPENRPDNAEVDNSDREWDYDLNDWVDLIESRPPGFEYPSPHLPITDRTVFLRPLGLALVLIVSFFLWLTWAFFSKAFTEYDDVTLTASKAGLALPSRADVKLRGMIIGTVRDVRVENGRVVLALGMNPQLIDRVPRDVRAEIVPKTLFGEKYISLIPTGSGTGQSLRAGDTITDAVVPVEFEKFLQRHLSDFDGGAAGEDFVHVDGVGEHVAGPW